MWWPRFSSPWWVVVAGPCQSDAWRDGSQSSPRGHEGKTHRHGLLIASWVGTAPCKLLPPTFPLNFPAADGKAMVRLGSGLSTMRVLSLPVPISQIWDQRTAACVGEAAQPIPAPSSRPRGPRVNPCCSHPLLTPSPPCCRQHGPAPLRDLREIWERHLPASPGQWPRVKAERGPGHPKGGDTAGAEGC